MLLQADRQPLIAPIPDADCSTPSAPRSSGSNRSICRHQHHVDPGVDDMEPVGLTMNERVPPSKEFSNEGVTANGQRTDISSGYTSSKARVSMQAAASRSPTTPKSSRQRPLRPKTALSDVLSTYTGSHGALDTVSMSSLSPLQTPDTLAGPAHPPLAVANQRMTNSLPQTHSLPLSIAATASTLPSGYSADDLHTSYSDVQELTDLSKASGVSRSSNFTGSTMSLATSISPSGSKSTSRRTSRQVPYQPSNLRRS